jgi:hypothetical protein
MLFQVFCCVVTSQMKKKRCTVQLRIVQGGASNKKQEFESKDNSNENAINFVVCGTPLSSRTPN